MALSHDYITFIGYHHGTHTHTHTHTTALRPFSRDYLGEPVPEKQTSSGLYGATTTVASYVSRPRLSLCRNASTALLRHLYRSMHPSRGPSKSSTYGVHRLESSSHHSLAAFCELKLRCSLPLQPGSTTVCHSTPSNGNWNPVYTIQPVVNPVVQPVWQTRFDNRVERTATVPSTGCQTG